MSVLDIDDWWTRRRQQWTDALKAKGHMPVMTDYDDQLDGFVYAADNHNGPGCTACGWSCCWHCMGVEGIPQCTVLELQATKIIGTAT